MGSGFEVYNPAGVLVFSSDSQTPKFLGFFTVPGTGAASGSFVDPKLTYYPGHVGFLARTDGNIPVPAEDAVVSIVGNEVRWMWPNPNRRPTARYSYGVR